VYWGERIEYYVEGMDISGFMADIRTQDAVIRCLEIIGEASGHILRIDPDFEKQHPELELAKAYRARNRTAHGYGSVDLETIWMSATVASPRLVIRTREILHRQSFGGSDG
jgi:uncharacterized protein with HEPN domain